MGGKRVVSSPPPLHRHSFLYCFCYYYQYRHRHIVSQCRQYHLHYHPYLHHVYHCYSIIISIPRPLLVRSIAQSQSSLHLLTFIPIITISSSSPPHHHLHHCLIRATGAKSFDHVIPTHPFNVHRYDNSESTISDRIRFVFFRVIIISLLIINSSIIAFLSSFV